MGAPEDLKVIKYPYSRTQYFPIDNGAKVDGAGRDGGTALRSAAGKEID